MGTYLWSYAVDRAEVAEVFGSKNKRFAKKVIAQADVDDNAEWFSEQIEKGAPRLDQAIEEIVAGKITKKKFAFQYVYAVERICRVVGKRVGDEFKVGGWIEDTLDPLLKKVKSKDFCHLMRLDKPAPPMKIPKLDDYPFCSSMTLGEVNVAIGAFARLRKRFETEPPDEESKGDWDFVFAEMNDRFRGATRRRCGLVNFMY